MKSFGKCRGCHKRKLVNLMRLCKRCNKEAHKYISKEEMAAIMKEHATLSESRAARAEKKAKAEEGAEGEQPEEGGEERSEEDQNDD